MGGVGMVCKPMLYAAATVLAAAGCGGDKDGGASTRPTTSTAPTSVKLKRLFVLPARKVEPRQVALSSDGKFAAVATHNPPGSGAPLIAELWVWDLARRKLHSRMQARFLIQSVHFLDGHRKVLGVFGGLIRIRDSKSLAVPRTIRRQEPARQEHYNYCDVIPGQQALIARSEAGLRMFRLRDGKEIYSLDLKRTQPWDHTAGAVTPDGRLYAEGGPGDAYILNLRTSKERRLVFPDWVRDIALSVDGRKLAVVVSGMGARKGGFSIIDTQTGKVLHQLFKASETPQDFVFSPDGQILAAAEREELSLWSVSSGQRVGRAEWSCRHGLAAMAFSGDGCRLVTAHYDTGYDDYRQNKTVLTVWKVDPPLGGPPGRAARTEEPKGEFREKRR